MAWLYISITILIIQIYVLTHTYTVESREYYRYRVDFNEAKKLGTPIWIILLIVLFSSTPIINIIEFIVFWVVWLKYYCEPDNIYNKSWYTYWIFKDKILSRKI